MSEKPDRRLVVTSFPHIMSTATTQQIMLDVVIALLPAAIASTVIFGWRSALVIAVSVACCVGCEAAWMRGFKKPMLIGDLSAVVTGLLLAFNLPVDIPLWQVVVGSVVAIIVVKQLFGGLGHNFVNPALAARVVLSISFAPDMTAYSSPRPVVDAVSSATPLSLIGNGEVPSLVQLMLGTHMGVLGETCAAALLAGGIYLVIKKVLSPIIPLTYIATTILVSWLGGCAYPVHAALSGGLLLGAIFMATDYATSPYTNLGRLVYGLGCGLFTGIIRTFGTSTEGVSYAILLMNLLLPYVNDLARRKPYGTEGGGDAANKQ